MAVRSNFTARSLFHLSIGSDSKAREALCSRVAQAARSIPGPDSRADAERSGRGGTASVPVAVFYANGLKWMFGVGIGIAGARHNTRCGGSMQRLIPERLAFHPLPYCSFHTAPSFPAFSFARGVGKDSTHGRACPASVYNSFR